MKFILQSGSSPEPDLFLDRVWVGSWNGNHKEGTERQEGQHSEVPQFWHAAPSVPRTPSPAVCRTYSHCTRYSVQPLSKRSAAPRSLTSLSVVHYYYYVCMCACVHVCVYSVPACVLNAGPKEKTEGRIRPPNSTCPLNAQRPANCEPSLKWIHHSTGSTYTVQTVFHILSQLWLSFLVADWAETGCWHSFGPFYG